VAQADEYSAPVAHFVKIVPPSVLLIMGLYDERTEVVEMENWGLGMRSETDRKE
jgi:hypothetical protein